MNFNITAQEIAGLLKQAVEAGDIPPYPELPHLTDIMPGNPRLAAVMILLVKIDNQWHLVLTRRNANLPEHSGQVAFPGGRSDPDDISPEMTALRETWEEIGIDPDEITILGTLNEFLTITNYLVTPVVGTMTWPITLRLAGEEVSRVFTIPLEWLADPTNHEERSRELPDPFGSISVIFYKEYDGEILWGASARFTLALLDILTNGNRE